MTAPIKYPTPTSEWGTVTHVAIPNPRWRWWAFWRPRGIVVNIPPRPVKEDESETVKLRRERDKAARDAAWYKERLRCKADLYDDDRITASQPGVTNGD